MRLDPDIAIQHLCGEQWVRLLGLFEPLPGDGPARPWIIRLHHNEQILKLWHRDLGGLEVNSHAALPIEELSKRYGNARVIEAELEALQELTSQWQTSLPSHPDVLADLLALAQIGRAHPGLQIYPPLRGIGLGAWLSRLAPPLLWPQDHCVVFLITREGQIWTSVILRRGARGLDLWTSSEAFFEELQREAPHDPSAIARLCELTRSCYGPVHGAFSAEWSAWWTLRASPRNATLRSLEDHGQIARPYWPLTWRGLLWGALRSGPALPLEDNASWQRRFATGSSVNAETPSRR